jgi:hypothetical protein
MYLFLILEKKFPFIDITYTIVDDLKKTPLNILLNLDIIYVYIYVVEWSRALDIRLSKWYCSVSIVQPSVN